MEENAIQPNEVDHKRKLPTSATRMSFDICKSNLSLGNKYISPGSLQSTRVASKGIYEGNALFFAASSNKLYHIKLDASTLTQPKQQSDENVVRTLDPISVEEEEIFVEHEHEIQSIVYKPNDNILASVDCYGNAFVVPMKGKEVHQKLKITSTSRGEECWHGIDVHLPSHEVAIATMMKRSISLYDVNTGKLLRSFYTLQQPTQIQYLMENDKSLIGVVDYNQLSVWDSREPSPVARVEASHEALYSMAVHPKGNVVGVAGATRTVYSVDARKWTVQGTWSNCTKYEITSVHYSNETETLCYAAGMNSSFCCGEWKETKTRTKFSSLQADSRWIGLAKFQENDTFVGVTELATVYLCQNNLRDYPSNPM